MVLLSGLLTCHSMGPQGHFFENIFWQWGHSSGSCCKNVWVCGLHGTWGRKNMGNTVLGHAVKEMALVLFTKDRDTSTTTLVKWKLLRHGRRDLHTWPSLVSLFALCSLNTHTLTLIYIYTSLASQVCTLRNARCVSWGWQRCTPWTARHAGVRSTWENVVWNVCNFCFDLLLKHRYSLERTFQFLLKFLHIKL